MDNNRSLSIREKANKVASIPGFPHNGIDIIKRKDGTEEVYVNQIGALWFLHNDMRGLRSISSECVIDAYSNREGRAKYETRIELKDGSVYKAFGDASSYSVPQGNRDTFNMIAETRSTRRAIIKATALTLINLDLDISEGEEVERDASFRS